MKQLLITSETLYVIISSELLYISVICILKFVIDESIYSGSWIVTFLLLVISFFPLQLISCIPGEYLFSLSSLISLTSIPISPI